MAVGYAGKVYFVILIYCCLLFHDAAGQNSNGGYFQTLQNAANLFQQLNINNETETFLEKAILSSVFPKMNQDSFTQILQSVNGGLSSLTQSGGTNVMNYILKSLSALPASRNISSAIMKGIMNMGDYMSQNASSDIMKEIMNYMRSGNLDITEIIGSLGKIVNEFTGGMESNGNYSMNATKPQRFDVSDECVRDLTTFVNGLMSQKDWALKMIDAMGKPDSGVLDGAMQWIGDYDECIRINSDAQASFEVKYCKMTIPVKMAALQMMQLKGFGLGVCFPKSCSSVDIGNSINSLTSKINIITTVDECKEEKEFDTRAIVVLCVCGFFIALMIIATLFDICFVLPEMKKSKIKGKYQENIKSTKINNQIMDSSKGSKDLENGDAEQNGINIQCVDTMPGDSKWFSYKPGTEKFNSDNDKTKTGKFNPGLPAKLLLSFSVYSNGKKLLSTKSAGGTLGAVNGVRFISMTWVMLGHSISFGLGNMKNMGYIYPTLMRRWTFMAVSNALLSVDTFFTLSGLLLAYVFMKEMKREKGRINWFMFYFHRFWRLTPPYMLVMMADIALSKYFGNGPSYPKDGFERNYCEDSWWRSLLYINNFFPAAEMCMAWGWYLTNDMQFYIISPLMLVPLYFSKKIGGFIVAVFLLGITVATITVSVVLELPSAMVSITGADVGDYFEDYYIRPYCRMGPYIVGLITGYILYKTDCKVKIRKSVNIFTWLMAFIFACTVLYGTFEESRGNAMSVPIAALYNATSRTIWGACVCWVIFSCCTGHGGFVNKFLSWKAFIPLGRLTYCAYLVHPIIMYAYFYSSKEMVQANEIRFTYDFLANSVISYAIAFLVSLAFESPMMGLEKTIFKRGK